MFRLILTALLAISLIATPIKAQSDLLSVRIVPHVALAPATIEVYVHVGEHPPDLTAVAIIDGDAYYAESSIPVRNEPQQLPVLRYKDLPAGTYTIYVGITDGEKVYASHKGEVKVVDSSTPPESI